MNQHIETLENTIDHLRKENEKLKKQEILLHNVWYKLYFADKSGCDVGFEDISTATDYYNHLKFIKDNVVNEQ